MILYKTAKYTVAQPLLLGGALAGAGPELLSTYDRYGRALGEAFQLRDDVLGVFGDPATTGKPAGDDLREGKRTVLVALTLERCSPAQAAQVRRRLGDPRLGADGVEALREVMVESGALSAVEEMIAVQSATARAALAGVDEPARAVLDQLVCRRHNPDGLMRRVSGPTDHVVVVGAGLGGLSAALRLAGAGRRVTVLEREPVPGGRAGLLTDQGYAFDTGPTVLTMPDLIADALDCVGERLSDWLTLDPVEPLYRARFADGSSMDVHASVDAMADEVAAVCGPAEADGYRRYVDFVSRALPAGDARLHRPQHRLAAVAAAAVTGPAGGRSAASAGSRRRSRSSSTTTGPSGCSRSRRCTPACRRTTRSRSTR